MKSSRNTNGELVGIADIGARLGLSSERIRQLARAGELPEAAGRLGRQEIWRWNDIASWAISTGRASQALEGTRQRVRAWIPGSPHLKLVIDEVVHWGYKMRSVVHVRIWEPEDSYGESSIVLLGNLEDNRGKSVTNCIEEVVNLVAAKYLGSHGRDAQFYEVWAGDSIRPMPKFDNVNFSVREVRTTKRSRLIHPVGYEFAEPSWRETSREEIERLIGRPLVVYTAGTYTSEFVEAVNRGLENAIVADWDPDGAFAASMAFEILNRGSLGPPVTNRHLDEFLSSGEQLAVISNILASHAVSACEHASGYTMWQSPDAPVTLVVPKLIDADAIREAASETRIHPVGHEKVWPALWSVRRVLGSLSVEDQIQLVPAQGGGLTRLAWWEAGVPEQDNPNWGVFGPVARLDRTSNQFKEDDWIEVMRFVEASLVHYLEAECSEFYEWESPKYRPVGPFSANGNATRQYLQSVNWSELSPELKYRRDRIINFAGDSLTGASSPQSKCGLDEGGRVVLMSEDQKSFWAEWPMGAKEPFDLDSTILADPIRGSGGAPVYLVSARRGIEPLPGPTLLSSSPEFLWGYFGSGPSNLTTAIVNAVAVSTELTNAQLSSLKVIVSKLVGSGHTPAWQLRQLVEEASKRSGVTP